MDARWTWIVRYVCVMLVAAILGAAFGEMDLFKTTRLGKAGLNAGRLAQFFGYGGALLMLWLLAKRASSLMPDDHGAWAMARQALVPFVTLIVVSCAQALLLLILDPFMSRGVHVVYNWLFIAAIILSAAWLVWTLFTGSSSLAPLFQNPSQGSSADMKDGQR